RSAVGAQRDGGAEEIRAIGMRAFDEGALRPCAVRGSREYVDGAGFGLVVVEAAGGNTRAAAVLAGRADGDRVAVAADGKRSGKIVAEPGVRGGQSRGLPPGVLEAREHIDRGRIRIRRWG